MADHLGRPAAMGASSSAARALGTKEPSLKLEKDWIDQFGGLKNQDSGREMSERLML